LNKQHQVPDAGFHATVLDPYVMHCYLLLWVGTSVLQMKHSTYVKKN